MKKLNLKAFAFPKGEVLTRSQLKNVMGGEGESESESGTAGSPKVKACEGKKAGDECIWTYQGTNYSGKCRSYMAQPLACSTLM